MNNSKTISYVKKEEIAYILCKVLEQYPNYYLNMLKYNLVVGYK